MKWPIPRGSAGPRAPGRPMRGAEHQLPAAFLHSARNHFVFTQRSKVSRIGPSSLSKNSYASLLNAKTKAPDTVV